LSLDIIYFLDSMSVQTLKNSLRRLLHEDHTHLHNHRLSKSNFNMNNFTLDFSETSQSFQCNHLIHFEPDVVGALKAVTARLRELDPNGVNHWINNNLRRFGVNSAYLSSSSSLGVFPFDISAFLPTINPTYLTQSIDPIARPYLSRTINAANKTDTTNPEEDLKPLPEPGDKITSNDRVAYLDGTTCQSLATEWATITSNSSRITNIRVQHKQLNRVISSPETNFELFNDSYEENDGVKKFSKVIANREETGSDGKESDDEKESCFFHQPPATGSPIVRHRSPISFTHYKEESPDSESEDYNSVDDDDYKDDDEGPESDDESGYDFEQCISRPTTPRTPPSSPPTSICVSNQKDELSKRYSRGGKSARKSAGKNEFGRTPLPSSPITKINNRKESPKRARTYGNDETRFPSSKVARRNKAVSPTGTRIRRPAWSEAEQNVLHQLLVERRAQEAQWPNLEKKFDNSLWSLISEQLMARFNIDRAPMACKNHWNRKGRHLSGFDERSAHKRSDRLATSVQFRKADK
jgi:hypothetical protein